MNEKLLPPNMSEVTSSNIIDTDCSSRDLADLVSSETVLADRHCVPLSHTIPIVDMRESTDADSSTKTLSEQMECIDLHPDPIVEGPTPHNIDDLGISQMGDDPKPNPGVTSVSTPLTPGTSGDQADRSDALRHAVLDAVAKSDAHFRHQQRGEPDLTFDEKWEIAAELLDRKPAIFLSRFGKHISSENAAYFEPLKHDYVIDFHLKEIEKLHNDKKNRTVVRNRRYEAMKKLVEGGDYFSDETMKHRDPLLYEQMVGQYLTEDEVAASIDKSDLTFSSILMSHIQMQYDNVLYNRQRDIEEGQMEESEDDDSDLDEDFGVAGRKPQTTEKEDLSEAERLMLRDEFLETMKLRFINGEDRDFNYSDVDNSVEYDPLDIRGHDEEEKYFDEDDTESTEPEPPCADVQMQD